MGRSRCVFDRAAAHDSALVRCIARSVVALLVMLAGITAGNLEYKVKAAFLFNFAKFIQWPEAPPDAPFVIGIVGADPFGNVLEQTVLNKTINGRKLAVRRFQTVKEIRPCQVLFVSASEGKRIGPILQSVEGAGTLTVSEISSFAALGGMINFVIEDNKVRFEINPEAITRAGLRANAQLLKLARVVREQAAE